jgi:hypothetical protein
MPRTFDFESTFNKLRPYFPTELRILRQTYKAVNFCNDLNESLPNLLLFLKLLKEETHKKSHLRLCFLLNFFQSFYDTLCFLANVSAKPSALRTEFESCWTLFFWFLRNFNFKPFFGMHKLQIGFAHLVSQFVKETLKFGLHAFDLRLQWIEVLHQTFLRNRDPIFPFHISFELLQICDHIRQQTFQTWLVVLIFVVYIIVSLRWLSAYCKQLS